MINDYLKQKIDVTLERLKAFEPEEGYYLAFGGGKDSVVCKVLCDMAGVKYDAVYRVTSVDPPELVQFIKNMHPDVKREIPHTKKGKPITMWTLIPQNRSLPTRIARFCCKYLKEPGGDGRKVVTGVRWAESVNRRKNQGLVVFTKKDEENDELVASGNFMKTSRGRVILVNDNEESIRKWVEYNEELGIKNLAIDIEAIFFNENRGQIDEKYKKLVLFAENLILEKGLKCDLYSFASQMKYDDNK